MTNVASHTHRIGTSGGYPPIGGPGHMPFRPISSQVFADAVFTGVVQLLIPPSEDRHDYKKKSGSSDSYNTYDSIET